MTPTARAHPAARPASSAEAASDARSTTSSPVRYVRARAAIVRGGEQGAKAAGKPSAAREPRSRMPPRAPAPRVRGRGCLSRARLRIAMPGPAGCLKSSSGGGSGNFSGSRFASSSRSWCCTSAAACVQRQVQGDGAGRRRDPADRGTGSRFPAWSRRTVLHGESMTHCRGCGHSGPRSRHLSLRRIPRPEQGSGAVGEPRGCRRRDDPAARRIVALRPVSARRARSAALTARSQAHDDSGCCGHLGAVLPARMAQILFKKILSYLG